MRGKESKAPPPSPAKVSAADVQGKEQNYLLDIVVVRLIFAITLDGSRILQSSVRTSGSHYADWPSVWPARSASSILNIG